MGSGKVSAGHVVNEFLNSIFFIGGIDGRETVLGKVLYRHGGSPHIVVFIY